MFGGVKESNRVLFTRFSLGLVGLPKAFLKCLNHFKDVISILVLQPRIEFNQLTTFLLARSTGSCIDIPSQ